jgi:hypothetical protein
MKRVVYPPQRVLLVQQRPHVTPYAIKPRPTIGQPAKAIHLGKRPQVTMQYIKQTPITPPQSEESLIQVDVMSNSDGESLDYTSIDGDSNETDIELMNMMAMEDLLREEEGNKDEGGPPRKRERLTHLSADEKMWRRKLKNRIAAQTARDRKKARMDDIEGNLTSIQSVNRRLLQDNQSLKRENKTLKERLDRVERELLEKGSDGVVTVDAVKPAAGAGVHTDNIHTPIDITANSTPLVITSQGDELRQIIDDLLSDYAPVDSAVAVDTATTSAASNAQVFAHGWQGGPGSNTGNDLCAAISIDDLYDCVRDEECLTSTFEQPIVIPHVIVELDDHIYANEAHCTSRTLTTPLIDHFLHAPILTTPQYSPQPLVSQPVSPMHYSTPLLDAGLIDEKLNSPLDFSSMDVDSINAQWEHNFDDLFDLAL